jgi:hypothetical protein
MLDGRRAAFLAVVGLTVVGFADGVGGKTSAVSSSASVAEAIADAADFAGLTADGADAVPAGFAAVVAGTAGFAAAVAGAMGFAGDVAPAVAVADTAAFGSSALAPDARDFALGFAVSARPTFGALCAGDAGKAAAAEAVARFISCFVSLRRGGFLSGLSGTTCFLACLATTTPREPQRNSS